MRLVMKIYRFALLSDRRGESANHDGRMSHFHDDDDDEGEETLCDKCESIGVVAEAEMKMRRFLKFTNLILKISTAHSLTREEICCAIKLFLMIARGKMCSERQLNLFSFDFFLF